MMVLLFATLLDAFAVSGELPQSIDAAAVTRISWVAPDGTVAAVEPRATDCQVSLPRGWVCHVESMDAVGVVLIETATNIGFVVRGRASLSAAGVAYWGRMIRVDSPDRDVEVTAMAFGINRPSGRPNTRSFDIAPTADVRIWPVGDRAFWITGKTRSPDVFIRITAEGAARHDEPLDQLLAGSADTPLDVLLQPPLSLRGRVEAPSGTPAAGAVVDLYALRPSEQSHPTPELLRTADVMRVAETRTDADGGFVFDDLETQPYKVAAVDFEHGRHELWTIIDGSLLVVRLRTPAKAIGRVLRGNVPVPGVEVRFIPDEAAWRDSRDPADHLTLNATTDDAGRFVLTLPPNGNGKVQARAPDGASARVALLPTTKSSDVMLGDIVLQEPIGVEVQTDLEGCTMWAVGPVGIGLSIVRARSNGIVHALQIPMAGRWLLQVECGSVPRRVTPSMIDVSAKGEVPTRSLHVE
jgi:hypothetical protein